MIDLLSAVGLVLAVEGALYAIAPDTMRRMAAQIVSVPSETLRTFGMVALAAGVGLVWLIRGG